MNKIIDLLFTWGLPLLTPVRRLHFVAGARRGSPTRVTHAFFIIIFFFSLFPGHAFAAGGACMGMVIPDELPILTGRDLMFTVNNTGTSQITGIKIMTSSKKDMPVLGRSSESFKLIEHIYEEANFMQGTLLPGAQGKFKIYTQTGLDERESVPWTIQATIGQTGEKITCSGYTQVRIKGLPLDGNSPQIGLDGIELLSSTSAQISWVTDKLSTTMIEYWPQGEAEAVLSQSVEEYIYNHQVVISDLIPEIMYEYRLRAADQLGNEGESEVGIFETIAGQTVLPTDAPRGAELSIQKEQPLQKTSEKSSSSSSFDWYIMLFWIWTLFKIIYLSSPFWILILLLIGLFL